MKQILVIIMSIGFTFSVNAQSTKRVYKKQQYSDVTETYYVLKSNENTKHGDYVKKDGGNVVEKGKYKQGKEDGPWAYYTKRGFKLAREGVYDSGKKIGIWRYYDNSDIDFALNFDTKDVSQYTWDKDENKSYPVFEDGEYKMEEVDNPVVAEDDVQTVIHRIKRLVQLPSEYSKTGEKGGVIQLRVYVNEKGEITNTEIAESPHQLLSDAVMQAYKKTSYEFFPAKYFGEAVSSYIDLPIEIKLK